MSDFPLPSSLTRSQTYLFVSLRRLIAVMLVLEEHR